MTLKNNLKDKAAIVGIGETVFNDFVVKHVETSCLKVEED